MKIAIVLNGMSLSKDKFYRNTLPAFQKQFQTDVFETQSKNDAVTLAAKAVAKKYSILLAAGGDGTLHQVVNGMLRNYESPAKLPVLGVLRQGTGNDFSRTLSSGKNAHEVIDAILTNKTKSIDIGEVEFSGSLAAHEDPGRQRRYFINVADVGMGPEVVRKVVNSGRPLGSGFSYFQSILSTFFSYKPVQLLARSEAWEWEGPVRTFAIANGKYYGNGLCIAPDALLDDGEFEVFACGDVSVLDFILQSIPLKQGKKIDHKEVCYLKGKRIDLSSGEPLAVEADGEILGWLPASVQISNIRIDILNPGNS